MTTAASRPISLHQLSVMEVDPVALVHHAADAGFDQVCLFTQPPPVALSPPLVTAANEAAVREALAARGLGVCNLEIFYLAAETDPEEFRTALDIGARLGGRIATIVIGDPDRDRARRNFTRTCAIMEDYGVTANLEFFAFSEVRNLPEAVAMVAEAGLPSTGVVIDTLHLIRTGSDVAALQALDPVLIGYIQLNDAPLQPPEDLLSEAIFNRMPPGEGEFPLVQLLAALPPGCPISIEAPMDRRRDAGEDAAARSRVLGHAARRVLDSVGQAAQ